MSECIMHQHCSSTLSCKLTKTSRINQYTSTMTVNMLMLLAPAVVLLQNTLSVSSLPVKQSLHRSRAQNYQRSPRVEFTGLFAGSEEEEDELSSNFLNFLKKTKEIEVDEDEEEEEITETAENVVKTKENIFKEIASGWMIYFLSIVPNIIFIHPISFVKANRRNSIELSVTLLVKDMELELPSTVHDHLICLKKNTLR